jgi:hypothetical protein
MSDTPKFSMKVSNEKLEGKDNVLPGEYDLKLIGFRPKISSNGQSYNLNPMFEITGHPEYVGRKVFDNLNSNAQFIWQDFCHALGLPMETDGNSSWLPGSWDKDKAKYNENDPATWEYEGPLVGRTAHVELGLKSYNGKESTAIRRYFCAVDDCAQKFPKVRHMQDLLKNSK